MKENFNVNDYKIIDFDKVGNVVRFYFGLKDLNDFYGDDWDDAPYEDNAGIVYDKFIKGYIDVAWNLDCVVCEPRSGTYNSGYCKNDFKKGNIPIIVVKYLESDEYSWKYNNFERCFANADRKIFIGDSIVDLLDNDIFLKLKFLED